MENRKKENNLLFHNIVYSYKGVAKHKPYLILVLLLSIISTIGTRYIWLFVSKYVVAYINKENVNGNLTATLITLTALALFFSIQFVIVQYWVDPAAYYIRPMFMLRRNNQYFHLAYEKTELQNTLDLKQKSINATSWPQNGIEGLIRKAIVLLSELAVCIVAMIILGLRSPIMIAFVILEGLVSFLIIDRTSKLEKKLTKDDVVYEKRKETYFTKSARDYSSGKDIRIFRTEKTIMDTIAGLNQFMHSKVKEARIAWIKCDSVVLLLEMMRGIIMYVLLLYMIIAKGLSISEFTLYIGCVTNFALSFQALVKTFAEARNCSREVNDFREFESMCSEKETAIASIPETNNYVLEFLNVSFKYPGADKYALKDFSLKIENASKLAVVGNNGAGKTTFIKLLLRLYEPTQGEIQLNGINIRDFSRDEYFRLFSPVFQDLEYYPFTLAENISMNDITETDVEKADRIARSVGLDAKLNEWPNGILTNISKDMHDDGVNLSGGELQKMGLARAIYKNAPIVILDEPTAALDALAESKVYEDFDKIADGKTAIYISHRLASTKFCDVIVMIQSGSIVEYGTHDELMNKHGYYSEMFEMQSCYYKEDLQNDN